MTIPGFLVINLLVGVSVAHSARIQIRTLQRPLFFSRYFTALMMLELMILLPAGAYFYAFYPDWSWMYLINTATTNSGIGVMVIISYPIATLMGYMVGYYSARGNSDWVALMFMVFVLIGLVGMVVLSKDKLIAVGTYDQFHRAAGTKPFATTSLLPSTILALIGIIICWLYLIYRFIQEGRLSLRTT